MALSTYFNFDTLQGPNLETNTFHESMPEEVAAPNLQHIFPYSDESLFLSNVLYENYIDPTGGFLYPPEINPPYYSFTSPTHRDDIFPIHEDYKLLPCPKRQKSYYEEKQQEVYSSLQEFTTPTLPSNFLDEFVVPYDNCCSLQAEELQQQLFYEIPQYGDTCVEHQCEKKGNERTISPQINFLDEFVAPYDNCCSLQAEELQQQIFYEIPQYGDTCVEHQCEKKGNERTISPQSVAARERRRKITKKTQELEKLVPGGPMMNTADMLHAAAKYVKFLQAQVGMLELRNTFEEDKAAPPSEILQALVVSPFVQEKLYTEERCFVPLETVTTLTNHGDVQSRPTILEDLKQLIGTDIEKKEKQE